MLSAMLAEEYMLIDIALSFRYISRSFFASKCYIWDTHLGHQYSQLKQMSLIYSDLLINLVVWGEPV